MTSEVRAISPALFLEPARGSWSQRGVSGANAGTGGVPGPRPARYETPEPLAPAFSSASISAASDGFARLIWLARSVAPKCADGRISHASRNNKSASILESRAPNSALRTACVKGGFGGVATVDILDVSQFCRMRASGFPGTD
jgi:hypothetical protein